MAAMHDDTAHELALAVPAPPGQPDCDLRFFKVISGNMSHHTILGDIYLANVDNIILQYNVRKATYSDGVLTNALVSASPGGGHSAFAWFHGITLEQMTFRRQAADTLTCCTCVLHPVWVC